MNLIERYLQAVGRELPVQQRDDILNELRSSLYDALEGEEGEPREERVIALLKEMGSPREVAASYFPAGQYLIGPTLYPTFVTVLKIAFTAVIGVQLVGIIADVTNARGLAPFDEIGNLLGALPMVMGWVVLVFWVLQRNDVQPDPAAPFDPRTLPALEPAFEPVNRGEQAVSVFFSVFALVLLAQFARAGGFGWVNGTGFFENPVIAQYFPWIVISTVIGIVLDIILMWRGRWETSTRVGSILSNLFSLGVLFVLIRGHNIWLDAAGVAGLFDAIGQMPALLQRDGQIAGMAAFRSGLSIAALVVAIETIVLAYRQLRWGTRPSLAVAARITA